MAIDFRSDQVQTNKIIVTGSNPQKTLLIYGIDADYSPPNQGNIDPSVFDTTVIGSDVFMFVSGVIGGKDGPDPGITVIGGDLHISGNLTIDGTGAGALPQMQRVNLAGYNRTNLTSSVVIGYGYFNPTDYTGLTSIEFSALGMNMAGVSGGLDLYDQSTSTIIAQLTWSGNSTLTTGSYQYSSFSIPAAATPYEIHLSQSGAVNGGSNYSMVGFVNFNLRW